MLCLAASQVRGQTRNDAPDAVLQESRTLASLGGVEINPMGGTASADEKAALLAAIDQYWAGQDREDFTPLEKFLTQYPNTAYKAAMLINLGYLAYHYGYYSRAVDDYEKAWTLAKALPSTDVTAEQKIISDAGIKLAGMYARLGRRTDLEQLVKDLDPYPKWGTETNAYQATVQGVLMMKLKPEHAFNCGPFALLNIALAHPEFRADKMKLINAQAIPDQGFSVAQLEKLAKDAGLNFQAARRGPNAEIPFPAVVHWKAGHYAAILEKKDGRYHVKDPTFLTDFWISAKALNEESSGLFLIAVDSKTSNLPDGWQPAGPDAAQTFGRGQPDYLSNTDQSDNSGPCPHGMAGVSFNLHEAKAYVTDAPVSYTPPLGPPVVFQINYFEGEILSPGPGGVVGGNSTWTMSYYTAVQDDGSTVAEYTPDGRIETYTPDNSTPEIISSATMERVLSGNTTDGFKEHFLDGSEWDYMQVQTGNATNKYWFLTKVIDPQGNYLTLSYDGSDRLTTITDAIGQNTTLTYNGTHTTYLQEITDPFGRTANLTYDGSGRLSTITDPVGIVSSFSYASGNVVSTVTTPYGNTTLARNFEASPVDGSTGVNTLLITDPTGARERIAFAIYTSFLPTEETTGVPGSYGIHNYELNYGATIYLGKKAMDGLSSANVTNDAWLGNTTGGKSYWQLGTLYKWCLDATGTYSIGVVNSMKPPLENRTFCLYENQFANWAVGTFPQPGVVTRSIQDQTGSAADQNYVYTHNALSNLLTATDPLGRVTTYTYDTNGIDLLTVQQGNDTVEQFSYNSYHQPTSITDAASVVTNLSYSCTWVDSPRLV